MSSDEFVSVAALLDDDVESVESVPDTHSNVPSSVSFVSAKSEVPEFAEESRSDESPSPFINVQIKSPVDINNKCEEKVAESAKEPAEELLRTRAENIADEPVQVGPLIDTFELISNGVEVEVKETPTSSRRQSTCEQPSLGNVIDKEREEYVRVRKEATEARKHLGVAEMEEPADGIPRVKINDENARIQLSLSFPGNESITESGGKVPLKDDSGDHSRMSSKISLEASAVELPITASKSGHGVTQQSVDTPDDSGSNCVTMNRDDEEKKNEETAAERRKRIRLRMINAYTGNNESSDSAKPKEETVQDEKEKTHTSEAPTSGFKPKLERRKSFETSMTIKIDAVKSGSVGEKKTRPPLEKKPSVEIDCSDIREAMAMQTKESENRRQNEVESRHLRRLERKASLELLQRDLEGEKSEDKPPRPGSGRSVSSSSPAPPPPPKPRFNPNLERNGIGIGSGINRRPTSAVSLPDGPVNNGAPRVNSLVQERMEKKRQEEAARREAQKRKNSLSRWQSMSALNSSSDDDSFFSPFLQRRNKKHPIQVVESGNRRSTHSEFSPPKHRSRSRFSLLSTDSSSFVSSSFRSSSNLSASSKYRSHANLYNLSNNNNNNTDNDKQGNRNNSNNHCGDDFPAEVYEDILTVFRSVYNDSETVQFGSKLKSVDGAKGIIVKPDRIVLDQRLLQAELDLGNRFKIETFIVYQVFRCIPLDVEHNYG